MDLSKLRADFDAANTLLAEEQSKNASLTSTITAKDAEIAQLRADLTAKDALHATALAEKDNEVKALELSQAELRGELKAAQAQVTKLEAEAKTTTVRAREILGQQALPTEAIDHLPDGSQRAGSPAAKPESAVERTRQEHRSMLSAFFPHLAKS